MMKFTLNILATLTIASMSIMALPAQATIVYDVSSTSVVNCSGAPHGLWTNGDIGGGTCSNYFDIQAGSTFTIFNDDADSANWYAELDATAKNPQNVLANIFLSLTGFVETYSTYKKEGGAAYNPLTDTPDIDFFTSVLGTITINSLIYDIDGFVSDSEGDYAFQYGLGGNAKSASEFGGSAWIKSCTDNVVVQGTSCMTSSHWDLNLKFTEVPEPTTLTLLGLGLIGLGFSRRKKL